MENTKKVKILGCIRCQTNSIENEHRTGCPRGSCEVEIIGYKIIKTTVTLNKNINLKNYTSDE